MDRTVQMVAFAAQYLPDPKYLMKNMLIENLYRISIKKYDCTEHNHSVTKFTELSHLRLFCTLEIEEDILMFAPRGAQKLDVFCVSKYQNPSISLVPEPERSWFGRLRRPFFDT